MTGLEYATQLAAYRKALESFAWGAPATILVVGFTSYVERARAILQSPDPGKALLDEHAVELADCVSKYIDDHGITCDCCQHVMIDVTTEGPGGSGKSHCITGDPEGEGVACAHGMATDMEALLKRAEAAEAMIKVVKEVLRSIVSVGVDYRGVVTLAKDALNKIEENK